MADAAAAAETEQASQQHNVISDDIRTYLLRSVLHFQCVYTTLFHNVVSSPRHAMPHNTASSQPLAFEN